MAKFNIDRISKINQNNFDDAKGARDRIEKPPFPKIRFEKGNFNFGARLFPNIFGNGPFLKKDNQKNVNQNNQNPKGGGNKGNPGDPNYVPGGGA